MAIAFAVVFGLVRAMTDGRFRGTHALKVVEQRAPANVVKTSDPSVLSGTQWATELGDRATLLQFSSAFCAPCRATRQVLADVAARSEGVTHLEVDAEHHLDLVRRLGIMRTPTTLVLDRTGHELLRASGAPRREQVESALADL